MKSASVVTVLVVGLAMSPAGAQEKAKDATEAARAANARLLSQLPFSDRASFEQAHKRVVAPLHANR